MNDQCILGIVLLMSCIVGISVGSIWTHSYHYNKQQIFCKITTQNDEYKNNYCKEDFYTYLISENNKGEVND